MKIVNEFTVGTPIDQTWDALTDLERIAPCMPGAQLQEVDGDEYKGTVKVKVGPITQAFQGTATFVSQDRDNYRAVISAAGREQRGAGTAQATIVTELRPVGDSTHVSIETDLAITGRAAQFGRGVLQDISSMLLNQFVQKLESDVLAAPADVRSVPAEVSDAPAGVTAAPARATAAPAEVTAVPAGATAAPAGDAAARPDTAAPSQRRIIQSAPAEPIDLTAVSASSVNRRLVPALAALAVILGIVAAFGTWSTGRWLVMAAIGLLAVAVSAIAAAPPTPGDRMSAGTGG